MRLIDREQTLKKGKIASENKSAQLLDNIGTQGRTYDPTRENNNSVLTYLV